MAKLSKSEQDTMKMLFEQNGLTQDDLFKSNHYIIISRSGIEKIQAKNDIHVDYEVVPEMTVPTEGLYAVKATAFKRGNPDIVVTTFGETSPKNNRNAYPVAMAEKRAFSRAVLKVSGLYQHGVFSEDESDSFQRPKK